MITKVLPSDAEVFEDKVQDISNELAQIHHMSIYIQEVRHYVFTLNLIVTFEELPQPRYDQTKTSQWKALDVYFQINQTLLSISLCLKG